MRTSYLSLTCLAALAISAGMANAGAVRNNAGFTTSTLAPNDDGSTGFVNFNLPGNGGNLNFFGQNYNGGFVNNNGNVTFNAPLGTYTPFPIISTGTPMLAPFFADVDTRAAGSPVTYGNDTVGGHAAFGVDWVNVDFFSSSTTHTARDSFQLVIIDRSDVAPGDFDFEFNIDQIQWETGQASGGDANGLGGNSARVGWSNGTNSSLELNGSAVNGAFLDSGPSATRLNANSINSNVAGRYVFEVRNGQVSGIPLPTTAGLGGLGLVGLAAARRRRTV